VAGSPPRDGPAVRRCGSSGAAAVGGPCGIGLPAPVARGDSMADAPDASRQGSRQAYGPMPGGRSCLE
jgi:hypothetical protein